MTLDSLLPRYDARDYHEVPVAADADRAYGALRALDLNDLLIVRLMFKVRPLLLMGRPGPPLRRGPFVDTAVGLGWRIMSETPHRDLVAAAVTQPWAAAVEFRGMSEPDFVSFAQPGFVKIAWTFGARPAGPDRSLVYTETRAEATDAAGRRLFRRYWLVFGPFIRLIRRLALARVARQVRAPSVAHVG